MSKFGKPLCMTHQKTIPTPPPPPRAATARTFSTKYFCYVCKQPITPPVFDYSSKNIGVALCMKHQKTVTPESVKLSKALRELEVEHQLEAYDGHKHVDVAIDRARLYIELDGSQHVLTSKQLIADFERDKHSRKDGYDTIRVANTACTNKNIYRLANSIKTLALKREAELREAENSLTVAGIVKSMIKTAVKLSKKLENFQ